MNLRKRIGVDLGRRAKIEDGIRAAIDNGIHYLDLKIDVAPNAVDSLTKERVKSIREACEKHDIHIGVHTLSAVNMAEVAPRVREGVDAYIKGHMDACKDLGGKVHLKPGEGNIDFARVFKRLEQAGSKAII